MFDWYPVISRGKTFFELFQEAFYWSFWHHSFLWILVFISIFKSKYIIAVFHRKIIASSFIAFIPLFAFCIIMFIQSSRFNNNNKKNNVLKKESQYQIENLGSRFQELPVTYQIFFLVLIFFLIFSISLLFSVAIWRYYFLFFIVLILSIYMLLLYRKIEKLPGTKMAFKSSDYIPVLILIIVLTLISTITIGDFVCAIPKFNCYFSCGICK
jgi:hypothetical protein